MRYTAQKGTTFEPLGTVEVQVPTQELLGLPSLRRVKPKAEGKRRIMSMAELAGLRQPKALHTSRHSHERSNLSNFSLGTSASVPETWSLTVCSAVWSQAWLKDRMRWSASNSRSTRWKPLSQVWVSSTVCPCASSSSKACRSLVRSHHSSLVQDLLHFFGSYNLHKARSGTTSRAI